MPKNLYGSFENSNLGRQKRLEKTYGEDVMALTVGQFKKCH